MQALDWGQSGPVTFQCDSDALALVLLYRNLMLKRLARAEQASRQQQGAQVADGGAHRVALGAKNIPQRHRECYGFRSW